jgi:N-acetylmuramoyl-L-alanine amidase
LTKSKENEKVTNRRRAEIANEAGAAVLLRLHCDAGKGSGYRIFYPDRTGTRFGVTGPSLEVIRGSHQAAKEVHDGMAEILNSFHPDLGIAGDSVTFVGGKQGALTGSIFSKIPALTLEMGVLTQPRDERFLVSPEGQRRLVGAMVHGLEHFFRCLRLEVGEFPRNSL